MNIFSKNQHRIYRDQTCACDFSPVAVLSAHCIRFDPVELEPIWLRSRNPVAQRSRIIQKRWGYVVSQKGNDEEEDNGKGGERVLF